MANPLLTTKVSLSISCSHLPKLDITSKSDPQVIVQQKDSTGIYKEIGRTEMISNNSNPQFGTQVQLQYFFEELQQLRFLVFDVDDVKQVITEFKGRKDFIGFIETTLGNIMGARASTVEKPLENVEHPKRKNGFIRITGFEVAVARAPPIIPGQSIQPAGVVTAFFQLSANHLDKKDFLGKSDPYVVIKRGDSTGTNFTLVHKTEYIKQNLNPVWREFNLPMGVLCSGDQGLPLKLEVWDWDKDGGDDFIGETITNFNNLLSQKNFDMVNPKKKSKKGYVNSGVLNINSLIVKEVFPPPPPPPPKSKLPLVFEHTFLEYVTGGTEISIMFGIDFTGSNGDPSQASSLHRRGGGFNQYQQAIRTIGDVVAPYDNDQLFPVYGFGGFVGGITSHCFPLNGNSQNPECVGVDGVLRAYDDSFKNISLSGPTIFAPIFKSVCDSIRQYQNGEKYTILLMMTDGSIDDMAETISVLRIAADLPLSIIIVGVGSASFNQMKQLDDDDGLLGLNRDCVQFVPFKDYTNQPIEKLAKDTLQEVPEQLLRYMAHHNLKPRPKPQFVSTIVPEVPINPIPPSADSNPIPPSF